MKQTWCIGKITGQYLALMEKILQLYARPYDEQRPVICFDERPCFLIGDLVAPIPMQEGKLEKQDHTYSKHGSCALLVAIEPLTGRRFAKVYERRTKKEYAGFMDYLASQYPEAQQIELVQDNLSTHTTGAFYDTFESEKALWLTERFNFQFTPVKASWLNMVEIELAALSKQCLDRRIPAMEQLQTQIEAIVKERNDKQIKIQWQFSVQNARETMKKHYLKVNENAFGDLNHTNENKKT